MGNLVCWKCGQCGYFLKNFKPSKFSSSHEFVPNHTMQTLTMFLKPNGQTATRAKHRNPVDL